MRRFKVSILEVNSIPVVLIFSEGCACLLALTRAIALTTVLLLLFQMSTKRALQPEKFCCKLPEKHIRSTCFISLRLYIQNCSKFWPQNLLVDLHSSCSPCASPPLALRHWFGAHRNSAHMLKWWSFIFMRFVNDSAPQPHCTSIFRTCSRRLVLIYCLQTHPCQTRPAVLLQSYIRCVCRAC